MGVARASTYYNEAPGKYRVRGMTPGTAAAILISRQRAAFFFEDAGISSKASAADAANRIFTAVADPKIFPRYGAAFPEIRFGTIAKGNASRARLPLHSGPQAPPYLRGGGPDP
jgi:hypothetical protein